MLLLVHFKYIGTYVGNHLILFEIIKSLISLSVTIADGKIIIQLHSQAAGNGSQDSHSGGRPSWLLE